MKNEERGGGLCLIIHYPGLCLIIHYSLFIIRAYASLFIVLKKNALLSRFRS